jgi:hypothetical protein
MFIQRSDSIGANATNDNTVVGNQFEFSNGFYQIEAGLVASAIGLEIDVLVSGSAVVTRMIPSIQNRWPVYPDDFALRFGMIPGDRLICRVRNTTGGALTLFQTFRFNPVAMGR